ncbi:AraC family transcriptional regulator [Sphingomonas hengshuiensis]|uniref:AraC family transcriptional regulator n=1 Tax=Sphingomonas hengshuiensis TaxID=1609977 RepID=UPI000697F751|nr:helix-turn-helix domain-containing protein [Sphingomonas hengshuiensis]
MQAADFCLPPGTALRYELAADPLRPVLSSYSVLDSDPAVQSGAVNWVLPGWARLWIILAPDPLQITIRNRHYPALRAAMLFGVTSRAMPVSAYGGVTVAIDIGPLAWARLFQPSAELLRDRITPLDELLPPGWSEDLITGIERSDRGAQVKGVLDDFFLNRMPPPHPQEKLIAAIAALLGDERTHDLAGAAARVGIGKRALLGLTKRYFGFPPKILSMRTRFLRALTGMLLQPDVPDFSAIAPGYHDASHFIRDANRFLGMTPRRFLAIDMPYTRAALRARRLVTGAALSALDIVDVAR